MTRDLYHAASLRLMLEMMAGTTFVAATENINGDENWWTDFLLAWTPKMSKKKGRKRPREAEESHETRPVKKIARPCDFYNRGKVFAWEQLQVQP